MADAGPSSAPKPFKSLTTALITPSASPPISHHRDRSRDLPPPSKRPRLASTPSSLPSLTRSTPTSVSSLTSEEIDDAKRQSALRVLNVWSQLEERYARALDEDDIIDFEHDVIIRDKGVLKKHKRIKFGTLADSVRSPAREEDEPSATDYEDDGDGDDVDELDAFASVADSSIQEQLSKWTSIPRRRLPPIGEVDPADKDDLQAFMEANQRMQFTEDDDDGSIEDVLQALVDRFSSSSEEEAEEFEEGYTSFEEDVLPSSGASLPPPSSSPPSSPMITPGPRTYTDDDFSEDEFAKWEEEEVQLADKTPQPLRLPVPEVIDLTSPSPSPFDSLTRWPTKPQVRPKPHRRSPSRSPSKPPSKPDSRAKSQTPVSSSSNTPSRPKSKTPVSRVPSTSSPSSAPQTPVRAKSNTLATSRRVREVTPPPIASSSKVQLPTLPRSSPSLPSFSDDPIHTDNPFLDDPIPSVPRSLSPLPPSSPIPSSVDPSPSKPRPKPRPKRRSSAVPPTTSHSQPDSDSDDVFVSTRSQRSGKARNKDAITAPLTTTPKAKSSPSDPTPKSSIPKARQNRVEVLITRQPSRAPSLPPPKKRTVSPKPSALKDPPGRSHPIPVPDSNSGMLFTPTKSRSNSKDKGTGKGKDKDNVPSDDSSPELKSKFAKNFTPIRSPSKEGSVDVGSPLPAFRGFKRKRVLSFSSDSELESDIPLASILVKRFSSPAKSASQPVREKMPSSPSKPKPRPLESTSPVKAKAKVRSPSKKPSSPPQAKAKAKAKRTPEVREKSLSKPARSKTPTGVKKQRAKTPEKSPEIISDSEPGSPSPPPHPSPKPRKSILKAPSQSTPRSTHSPSSSPRTPPRKRSQSHGHEPQHHPPPPPSHTPFPSYPPIPPISAMHSMSGFPAQDPQAQFHFAHAIHHLAYLMTGSALNTGTPHSPYPIPWPPPYMPQQPQQQPHRHRSRHASEEASSPGAGPSRSRSDPIGTPTRTSHPYPYSYDPHWSSSTLPPSSPPRSSSPPTSPVLLRPALRERSRSRGRRVSFKLGDDDRPHVRPGQDDDDEIEAEEEEEEEEREVVQGLSTPDRLAILASPEIPIGTSTRSRRRRSTESPCPPSTSSRGQGGTSSEADDGRERGQTPGPPERSRSLARR